MRAHIETLDGLRGVAALSVVIFHFLEIIFSPDKNVMCYTYLAVDFFFVLSGFVLGYAYDHRLAKDAAPGIRLSIRGFFLRRLIRLHPLLIVGMLLGLLEYVFNPFAGTEQRNASFWLVAANLALGALALPGPCLPGCYVETHPLNGPAWSLTQEYLANVFYGLFGKNRGWKGLAVFWAVSAVGITWVGVHFKDLSLGWDWPRIVPGLLRVCVSFSAGLLVYRLNLRLKLPWAFPVLSAALLCVFVAPHTTMKAWNGMYDVLCVLIVFPLMVAAGAGGGEPTGWMGQVCRAFGRLSYPLYILHYPFVFFFVRWLWLKHPPGQTVFWVVCATMAIIIPFVWLVMSRFDEPFRAWLSSRLQPETPSRAQKSSETRPLK
jgi:peptidoglycan/LPS O-acetylase OafA/YrhL